MPSIRPATLARCRAVSTSSWSDAIDATGIGRVASGLRWRCGGRIAGRAVTVQEEVGDLGAFTSDDFALGRALRSGGIHDVLVFSMNGASVSTFGGNAARAAFARGFAAAVIDGSCRDLDELRTVGITVVSSRVGPVSGRGRVRVVEINGRIMCGGAEVSAGDLVVADETGVVFVPKASVTNVLAVAERITAIDPRFEDARPAQGSIAKRPGGANVKTAPLGTSIPAKVPYAPPSS